MNEKFYEKYSCEEQEVIVLIQKVIGASPFLDKLNMLATTLGMVFCADNKIEVKKGRLNWLVTNEERNSKKGWNRFQKGQICRIKVRKLLDEYAPNNLSPEEFNAWCVVEVLEQSADCPKLQDVWAEYIKPVILEDEVLGTLTLNREFYMLEGKFLWNGTDISLVLEVNENDQSSWKTTCNFAKNMVEELEKWDKTMRAFAAKELTSLANEWMADDDENENAEPITEEVFAERISLSSLIFSFEDEFTVYYDDDDMFWGHTVEVYGSIDKGIVSVNIAG